MQPTGNLPPSLVLLVEDDDVSATIASLMLENLACDVTRVGDGQSAIHAAASGKFHCVLMDWQLPDMTGLDATRRIRAQVAPSPPIIGWTAHRGSEELHACLDAGMDDVMTKPVSLTDLRAMLAKWIPARRG